MNTYFTTSLAEACFLMCKGYEPLEVRPAHSPSIKAFVFPGECREISQGFYNGNDLVSARDYHGNFQTVKRWIRS